MKKEVKVIIIISLIVNILLTVLKLVGGYLGKTTSLVSDGYNSMTDIIISLMLIITISLSTKKPDKDHPYGHEKYEGIISLIIGLFLFLTAGLILFQGISNLIVYDSSITYYKPRSFTIYIAIISIVFKLILYTINYVGYKKLKQVSLKAESFNHLGDIFATSASLIGIIFASNNLIYIDYIASILIGLIIAKNAFTVTKESISFLVDEAPKKEDMKEIKAVIKSIDGVVSIDELRARKHVSKVYVDVEISVSPNLTLLEAHEIAEDVHITVEHEFPEVIHCMVHVNPSNSN